MNYNLLAVHFVWQCDVSECGHITNYSIHECNLGLIELMSSC